MEQTGLARSTIGAAARGAHRPGPGRRGPQGHVDRRAAAGLLVFNAAAGVVLAVDAGASRVALAISDLNGESSPSVPRCATSTPTRGHAGWACDGLDALLAEVGRSHADVRCVGVGPPGSVDFDRPPVSPLLMPGWDGFPVAETLRAHFGVDVLVDSDVNVMALGEARQHDPDEQIVV